MTLRSVHDLGCRDNYCPPLSYGNLQLPSCDPSIPTEISSHRWVAFSQVFPAFSCHLDFSASLPCFCLPFVLHVQVIQAFRVDSRHQQSKHVPGMAHFRGWNFSHSNCDVLPHSIRFNPKYSWLFLLKLRECTSWNIFYFANCKFPSFCFCKF